MEIRELLALLDKYQGPFPEHLVAQAVARREEIIPALLETLEEVARDPEPWLADQERMGHIYALYLLALFRETRTSPLLVRIFSRPGEFAFDLAGDVVTEDLGRILASVSGGDLSGITALIENEQANGYVRSAAMGGMVSLVLTGQRTREEVMAYALELFRKLERKSGEQWDGLACVCVDLWPEEAIGELQRAYEDGLVDTFAVDWEDIEDALKAGKQAAMQAAQYRTPLITDLAKDMSWMQCFQGMPDYSDDEDWDEAGEDWNEGHDTTEDLSPNLPWVDSLNEWPGPIRRAVPKIGRNEPCPCGSGKKFKKCCGKGDSAAPLGRPN